MYYAVLILFMVVSVLLILLTLLQKGGGGVGAAFGSGMGQSVFGAGGMDTILTKITYWLGAAFLILAIILSIMPKGEKESILKDATIQTQQESKTEKTTDGNKESK
jgi:preprotein translocase subunit SecG